jgi:hypothetical protein
MKEHQHHPCIHCPALQLPGPSQRRLVCPCEFPCSFSTSSQQSSCISAHLITHNPRTLHWHCISTPAV